MNKPNSEPITATEGWKTIDWQKVERYVFKLQKRIYAASRRGEMRQVRQLQKTLMNSWSNKVLAVRRVTQDNRGRNTAGVDGIKSLTPKARMNLIGQLKLTGKSKPTRRVWIPKPGKEEKRPLGIPTIYERALQALVKTAIEPEWEAIFEAGSYGFRPGRSCHDAISHIKLTIQQKPKYVLDADIAKCFDRINHNQLLSKLNYKGKVRQQIKAWLKSGVIDEGVFTATTEGSPQGGVISPLLANIALHGLEEKLLKFITNHPLRYPNGKSMAKRDKCYSLTYIRYADDFVILHEDKQVVQKCQQITSEWLKDIGLELKPEKTRLTHTLLSEESEDKQAGFDFLGFHIQQFPAGKYVSARNSRNHVLGFNTFITPSKESCKSHQQQIGEIIKKHINSPQAALITNLNPVIRGWCNYYSLSDAQSKGVFAVQKELTYIKLRRWAYRRCGTHAKGHKKYFHKVGKNKYTFATREGNANPLRLFHHDHFPSSSNDYVKVKGEASPYDGKLIYWSKRKGFHPEMPNRKAKLLKQQKGKCKWCNLTFREEDILEEDHILAIAIGGKNEWSNFQLLHGHCHDEKTAIDIQEIRKQSLSKFIEGISQELIKLNYRWIDDMLIT